MKNRFKFLIAMMMTLIMAFTMGSCSLKADADEIFSGELVDAQNDRLVVKNSEKTMLFVTTDQTEYDFGEDDHLSVGDKLDVTFHKDHDMYTADSVVITEKKDETLVFGGKVTELENHYITVRSESLTAGFDYDDETIIDGNLSEGDAVTITYKGNISERPHAISIVVIQENREETLKSISGTIAEATDKSVLVSIDSADAARFKVTEDTIIEGDEKKLIAGDQVTVVYTGDIGKDPIARTIKTKKNKEEYFVMDGVIDKVAKDKLTIKTMNATYNFKVTKDTEIQNKKYLEKDHKCTITYQGDLFKNPTAASIYCSKKTVTEKEKKKATKTSETVTKATRATETKPTETKTEPTETKTEPTETKTEPTETQTEPTETQTEPTETQTEPTEPPTDPPTEATKAPEPKPVIVKAKGVINSWGKTCAIKIEGGGTVNLSTGDASISGGYVPQAGDQVLLSYDKDSMALKDIQLEYRPADEVQE